MKELFESMEAVMKAQQEQIKMLREEVNSIRCTISSFNRMLFDQYDAQIEEQCFSDFKNKHGSKFDEVSSTMKIFMGDDYDPVKSVWDEIKTKPVDGFDEDAAVDGVLAETIKKLDELKKLVPLEQQSAIEEVKEEVKEAALVNDGANADGEAANQNVESGTDDWASDMEDQNEEKNPEMEDEEIDEEALSKEWESKKNRRGY